MWKRRCSTATLSLCPLVDEGGRKRRIQGGRAGVHKELRSTTTAGAGGSVVCGLGGVGISFGVGLGCLLWGGTVSGLGEKGYDLAAQSGEIEMNHASKDTLTSNSTACL